MGRAMIETDVAIVGAGGGGAVLALMLAQQGVRSLVLERAAGPPQGLRGEILQPNGQRVLDRLGLLDKLPAHAVRSVRRFNFCRAGGERLCTVDYSELPAPYNRALVTLPNVAHHAILDALEQQNPGALWYDATFTGLRFDGSRVIGLQATRHGEPVDISARLVVGADGALSKVRESLGITAQLHRYPQSYLIAILKAPPGFDEATVSGGASVKSSGLFPAAGQQVYAFYMIKAGSYEAVKAQGLGGVAEGLGPDRSRHGRDGPRTGRLEPDGLHAHRTCENGSMGGGRRLAHRGCGPRHESACIPGADAGDGGRGRRGGPYSRLVEEQRFLC
jgi:monooxygenase